MSTYQDVTFYLQVEPEWRMRGDGSLLLAGAKAARMTQKQPDNPLHGATVVRLTVRMPSSRLQPLMPEIVVLPDDGEMVEVASG